ncbi:virulence protein RhuM/Fic/DOC family protein [Leifsonia shinshuensis]|uniref:Fic/DOC family protein n=1 Tax=Leifsonia shinshuensis TaxID=150026 RepID=A0A7G6YDI6_9MICO|nr:virulence protein RhuM/Fic/DOC family protein [Leifsonia shinshuensis]QNE36551.1 Fic/DOC family protein [Leifsonia shinshuensis]
MDDVEIYQSADGAVRLEVRTDGETVWLTQAQMTSLFGRDRTVIVRHIANAEREELDGIPTRAYFAQVRSEGARLVERDVEHFNLDVVLSVGYRVKSAEGVQFRRWANDVLRHYVVEGVATNEARLREIGAIVQLLGRSPDTTVAGIAEVLKRYTPGLELLDEYDRREVPPIAGETPSFRLTYDSARQVIDQVATQFPHDNLLGLERGDAFRGIIGNVEQTYLGEELYDSVQEKAAHLLYFVTKDHPLADGNKRSAAALFTWYLEQNRATADDSGHPLVSPKMLAAVTLMTAMSRPDEKESMIRLIGNLITR